MSYRGKTKGSHGNQHRGKSFSSSNYKGHKIEFKVENGRVWASAPDFGHQYLGYGNNKSEALADAQEAMDGIFGVLSDVTMSQIKTPNTIAQGYFNEDGRKKMLTFWFNSDDEDKWGSELYDGANYIPDSKAKSYSRNFVHWNKMPDKYKKMAEELRAKAKEDHGDKKGWF